MNTLELRPAWKVFVSARLQRWKRRQWGFVRFASPWRARAPDAAESAQARFEHEARHAKREWMML